MLECDFNLQYPQFNLTVKLNTDEKILGVIGPSGSGKSSFLKALVGLLTPTQGSIVLNQRPLLDTQKNLYVPMHQRKIALVFQRAYLFPHMNVAQNLKYAQKLSCQKAPALDYSDIVNMLELNDLLKRKSQQLSGGEAQRVSLARALLSSPDLLLLDEPLTGLDQRLREQVLPFLNEVIQQAQIPMIYVTHHIDELNYLNAPILALKHGVLAQS